MCPPEKPLIQKRSGSNETLLDASSVAGVKLDTSNDAPREAVQMAAVAATAATTAVLTSAPPPWHSVALLVVATAVFVQCLPTWEQIDTVATLTSFSRAELWIGSPLLLGLMRLGVATSIVTTSLLVLRGPGWTQVTNWKPGSRLRGQATITLKGVKTMFPFTSWSWNLLGLSYSLNALIALCVATQNDQWITNLPHNWLLRLALIAWEIAAPCAFLVSTVIRYAIWEMVLSKKGDTTNLKSIRNVMMHNANAIFVVIEVALLGGLPVRFTEVSLAPLFGVVYVVFTWCMAHRWTAPEHGPQFIYYFMDTTMGMVTTVSLLALITALILFYILFAAARAGLDLLSDQVMLQNGEDEVGVVGAYYSSFSIVLLGHVGFVILLSSAVCRFRD